MPIAFPTPTPGPDIPQPESGPAPRRPDECEHEREYECECARASARDSSAPSAENGAEPRRITTQRSPRAQAKRLARQARFYADRLRDAHTPTQRVAIAWERWRSLVRHHDETHANRLAEQLFAVIDQQIKAMIPDRDQPAAEISEGGGQT